MEIQALPTVHQERGLIFFLKYAGTLRLYINPTYSHSIFPAIPTRHSTPVNSFSFKDMATFCGDVMFPILISIIWQSPFRPVLITDSRCSSIAGHVACRPIEGGGRELFILPAACVANHGPRRPLSSAGDRCCALHRQRRSPELGNCLQQTTAT